MSGAAAYLDSLAPSAAADELARCCGARRWVEGMLARRPFGGDEALFAAADEVWAAADRDDILEAFTHHPKIGDNIEALRAQFAATASWSAAEQGAVAGASDDVLERLRAGNINYEQRFGFIFIVCATGKTAGEMLALLEARLENDPADELRIAAGEQAKITRLRLEKLAS